VSHIPGILVSPIASSLVPYLSAELAKGNRSRAAELSGTAMRFVSIITLPAMTILGLFGEQILSLVFDPTSAKVAAPILTALSPSIFFFGLSSITSAILEANGRCTATLRSMSIGAAVKLILGFFLIGNPRFGIYGAVLGSVASYATASVLNLIEIRKALGQLPAAFDFFARPFAAACISAFLSVLLHRWIGERLFGPALTLTLLSFAGMSYLVLLPLFRAILPDDLAHLPFISKKHALKLSKD
jgi:stage V sporulation protein B